MKTYNSTIGDLGMTLVQIEQYESPKDLFILSDNSGDFTVEIKFYRHELQHLIDSIQNIVDTEGGDLHTS